MSYVNTYSDAELQAALSEAGSFRALARELDLPWTTVRDECRRRGISSPAKQTLAAEPVRPAMSREEMGVASITVTEAKADDGTVKTTTRTVMKPVSIRRATAGKPRKIKALRRSGQAATVMVLSDYHAPIHDEALHRTMMAIAKRIKPDAVIVLGDLLDFSAGVSRHAAMANGAPSYSPQECLDAGYEILRDIRAAIGPEARLLYMDGNHDVRAQRAIANLIPSLDGLRVAGGGEEVVSIPHLLRFDELSVEYVLNKDGLTYPHATLEVVADTRTNAGLVALHGVKARRGAGASALATSQSLGVGVIMGHCHRLAATSWTRWTTDGQKIKVHAIEAGTMAKIDSSGMGYAAVDSIDQAAGAVVLNVFDDGTVHPELLSWENGQLIFRGQVWSDAA